MAKDGVISSAKWIWRAVICLPFRLFDAFVDGLWALVKASRDVFVLLGFLVFLFYAPFGLLKLSYTYLLGFANLVVADPETDKEEEDDIMQQKYKTRELLLSVDEVIINDGPILETMAEVLKQTHTPPHFITAFVLGCIQHRIGAANADLLVPDINGLIRGLLDLRTLSESAWNLLSGLIGETLEPHLPEKAGPLDVGSNSHNSWMTNAAAMLVANSQRPLPERAVLMLSSPTTLAKILQLVRVVIKDWPLRDVISLLWIAFAAPRRDHDNMPAEVIKYWDSLPSPDGRTLSDLQEATIQILLENTWREDDEDLERHTAEATLMLIFLLDGSPPSVDFNSSELRISLNPSFYDGHPISNVESVMGLLRTEYSDIASQLLVAVGKSSNLVMNALNVYRAFVTRSLINPHGIPLWKVFHGMKNNEVPLSSLQPVLLDLWRFLLKCARSVGGGDRHLQTHDFIKLCIILAQPGIPRIFGRKEPANDWNELVPVLVQTADEGTLIETFTFAGMSTREETISALADRALEELGPSDLDVPEQLRDVLARLAGKGPKPPPKQGEPSDQTHRRESGGGILGIRLPFIPRPRRPDDPVGGANRPPSLALEAGSIQIEPTGPTFRSNIRHSNDVPPTPGPLPEVVPNLVRVASAAPSPGIRPSVRYSRDAPPVSGFPPVVIPNFVPTASPPAEPTIRSSIRRSRDAPPTPGPPSVVVPNIAPLASAPPSPAIRPIVGRSNDGPSTPGQPPVIIPDTVPSAPPSPSVHTVRPVRPERPRDIAAYAVEAPAPRAYRPSSPDTPSVASVASAPPPSDTDFLSEVRRRRMHRGSAAHIIEAPTPRAYHSPPSTDHPASPSPRTPSRTSSGRPVAAPRVTLSRSVSGDVARPSVIDSRAASMRGRSPPQAVVGNFGDANPYDQPRDGAGAAVPAAPYVPRMDSGHESRQRSRSGNVNVGEDTENIPRRTPSHRTRNTPRPPLAPPPSNDEPQRTWWEYG
ncbi:uncharacterized protein PHACADRAFT_23832 [Phanerochaete carnosa HHB-10118-sp]|uniref:Uncharacterized protein n=1 Tax=Phanerochaete carnosa (strain HHB-10118-sp) TaxID=650164 RepID=K5W9A7_PHACS|nr:uncharacterized protein PHACADRAFT_23832 [Phanerochaete carnosa HHB-10118-sp]EKM60533.1 hypothetical protein PHACADRAFT_23832 [Phanerochaete carnosa HHB-10118-sp]